MIDTELHATLDRLVPRFEHVPPAWDDAVRRGGLAARRRRAAVAVATAAVVGAAAVGTLAFTPLGHALVGGAFDRLSAWVGTRPGAPAPPAEQEAVNERNARAAAPIPSDTELGLLTTGMIDGESFDLLGFRDHGSLCLRLRSSAGDGAPVVKAPADCVVQQLLVDLAKPLAVVAAANPFPRHEKPGLQALYGLAADGVAAIELTSERGTHRVPVENNAFLYLYRGEEPRQKNDRLEYASDVPSKAIALDARGHPLGTVEITSLKRGSPAPPSAAALPGPSALEREVTDRHVAWIDDGENRGRPYDWRNPDGTKSPEFDEARIFRPNPGTSLRVIVIRSSHSGGRDSYCLTNLWPLEERPSSFQCAPAGRLVGMPLEAETVFDDQFPVYYGLVPDEVRSLELILENGSRESIPIVDNLFALQAASASPAKLVGYDDEGRVVLLQVLAL